MPMNSASSDQRFDHQGYDIFTARDDGVRIPLPYLGATDLLWTGHCNALTKGSVTYLANHDDFQLQFIEGHRAKHPDHDCHKQGM